MPTPFTKVIILLNFINGNEFYEIQYSIVVTELVIN